MHIKVNYADKTDEDAVADIREWLSPLQWNALCTLRDEVLAGKTAFGAIVFGLEFAGISGFPVHAFGRTFCPEAYEEWINTKD